MPGIATGMKLTPARLNHPVCRARATVTQTIANNSWTSVNLGAEDVDTHGMHSIASATSRFVVPAGYGGIYELSGGVSWASSATGQRWTRWARNGTEIDGSGNNINANSAGQTLADARTITVSLAPGDYVELQAFQTSGGNLDTYVGVAYAQSQATVKRVMIA